MRSFLKNVAGFGLLLVFFMSSIAFANRILVNSHDFSIPADKNIIVLGDSNAECAVNDKIFTQSINLSQSADSYFYSYLKLKKILTTNPAIDTVLLSFSPHNIFDNGWLLDEKHINTKFKTYYPLMGLDEFSLLFKSRPRATFRAVFSVPKQTGKNIANSVRGKTLFRMGKFKELERNILEEVRIKLVNGEELPFFRIPEMLTVSENESRYLKKIISICNHHGVNIYLVNFPKREELLSYKKYGVAEFYEFYDNNLKTVGFLDFSRMPLPEKYYGDFVHLNKEGADFFSNLLEEEDLQQLIQQYQR